MTRASRLLRCFAIFALLAASTVNAQADLPNLSTATEPTATTTGGDATTTGGNTDATSATKGGTTATSTGDNTSETGKSSATNAKTSSGNEVTTTATFPDASSSSTGFATTGGTETTGGTPFSLTGLPTIAGAGIPTLVIPYTADAPFMQKSTMPEGTVFIAVGAVLAFLGACVLLWRGLVAWSINRSVKRAAYLAIGGPEKRGTTKWGGSTNTGKKSYYNEYETTSSMSLDALTSSGKPLRSSTFEADAKRHSSAPPAGLFFSPTAHVSSRAASAQTPGDRGSGYLPAGYYASPTAEAAGGRNSLTVGGSIAPYARHSFVDPSPPSSPGLPDSRSTANYYGGSRDSRTGLRAHDGLRNSAYGNGFRSTPSREGMRASSRDGAGRNSVYGEGFRVTSNRERGTSRDGYGSQRNSHVVYPPPSSSSLMVGQSQENLAGSRAPSQVMDEIFDHHGNGPRERF